MEGVFGEEAEGETEIYGEEEGSPERDWCAQSSVSPQRGTSSTSVTLRLQDDDRHTALRLPTRATCHTRVARRAHKSTHTLPRPTASASCEHSSAFPLHSSPSFSQPPRVAPPRRPVSPATRPTSPCLPLMPLGTYTAFVLPRHRVHVIRRHYLALAQSAAQSSPYVRSRGPLVSRRSP